MGLAQLNQFIQISSDWNWLNASIEIDFHEFRGQIIGRKTILVEIEEFLHLVQNGLGMFMPNLGVDGRPHETDTSATCLHAPLPL